MSSLPVHSKVTVLKLIVSLGAMVIAVWGCKISGVDASGRVGGGGAVGVIALGLQVTLGRINKTRHRINNILGLLIVFISRLLWPYYVSILT